MLKTLTQAETMAKSYVCISNSLPESAVGSLCQVPHPVLGEVDVQAIEESSQKTSHRTHGHKDDQVVDIPQLLFILSR